MTLLTLPDQATDVPWPTADWPVGPLPTRLDKPRFDALIDEAFTEPASDLVGLIRDPQVGQLLFGSAPDTIAALAEAMSYVDYFVVGSFQSPQLFNRVDAAGKPLPFDKQTVRIFELFTFGEDGGLAIFHRVDFARHGVRHVDRSVRAGGDVVQELRAVDRHARRDFSRRQVNADHLVNVRDPKCSAVAPQPLRRVWLSRNSRVAGYRK